MTLYAAAKVAAYRRWLADCGLGVADVAFVGTLGAPRKPGDLRFEAARRRDHLLGAIGALLGAMPEGLAAAAEAGTFAGVEAALPGFDDAQRLGLLGHVIGLRHLALSLLVPDASDDAPSLASAEPPAWFRTRSFALALSHARSMSLVANLLAERPAHLAASLFAAPTCRASAAAGWLHLLCLRLAPADPLPEGYSPSASLAACLRAIESSALPPAQPAHLLLSRLADPCSPPPARSDLAALAVNSWGCVHLLPSQRTAAGACWACLSGAPPDPAAHLPDQGDPMASLPRRGSDVSAGVTRAGSESSGSVGGSGRAGSVGLLGRRGSDARRVRFHPDVYVFRAHSRESYPRAGGDGAGAAG
ncbi:hypothetical protein DFJ74DRAFT_688226 [Hyaloraphidium curvatum]|nr:hypothetical protein DFJ74DRAFT_688226 [Hyaloraphidium curvatum]